MLRRVINPFLFLPIALSINSINVLSSETKNKIYNNLGEAIYIPSIMLKLNTDLFLDDKNIAEVESQLNTKIHVLDDSNDIINTLIG